MEQIQCALCGRIKGAINHWLRAVVSEQCCKIIARPESMPAIPRSAPHLCSESCVGSFTARWASEQRVQAMAADAAQLTQPVS